MLPGYDIRQDPYRLRDRQFGQDVARDNIATALRGSGVAPLDAVQQSRTGGLDALRARPGGAQLADSLARAEQNDLAGQMAADEARKRAAGQPFDPYRLNR